MTIRVHPTRGRLTDGTPVGLYTDITVRARVLADATCGCAILEIYPDADVREWKPCDRHREDAKDSPWKEMIRLLDQAS